MSTYEDYELTQTDGTYTYFEPNNNPDPNATDLFITDSLDAATSSLQLGTDPLETQVIEIGSAGVTTTVYGAVNFLHPINVLSTTITNGLNVGGKTTLANVSATELTSTGIDASIIKTTTLNATGTSTLGPVYAGNCSLLNVSAARVELNTLTAVNCSVSNVSVSRLDANTLTATNVSTTNFTVGNVLSAIPIPTGYTIVADTVGTAISLNTFTYATPNGVAAQIGQDNFYTYTSTYDPPLEYNTITGKLNLTPVFAQTTYRVCISVNALNNPVDLSFQDDANTLFTIGTIETSPRKKYVFYLKPTVTGRLYLTISRAALSGAAEIQYDFLSVDAWYETNLTTVNATGSALLASSGGQVGIGTTDPRYTLDVSGTMRVTGEAVFDNFTLQNLSIQDFTTTNLTAPLVSTNQTLGQNITTGSVTIAGGMTTSGTVNIGNAMTTSTGGINIGTALTTGSVNIGSATGTTNMRGTVLVNTLNTINTTDAMSIGSSNTGGITIGGSTLALNPATVNINTVAPTDNLKQTTIGATNGLFDTNTTISGKTTINKLATPLTPIYTYPVVGEGQIGYVYPTIIGTAGTISITINVDTQLLSRTVPAGVFLVSAYYRTYTTASPTYSSIAVGPSVGPQPDSSSVITNSSITPTSFVTCFLNFSSEGTIYSSALVGASGSISRPTCILKVARVA